MGVSRETTLRCLARPAESAGLSPGPSGMTPILRPQAGRVSRGTLPATLVPARSGGPRYSYERTYATRPDRPRVPGAWCASASLGRDQRRRATRSAGPPAPASCPNELLGHHPSKRSTQPCSLIRQSLINAVTYHGTVASSGAGPSEGLSSCGGWAPPCFTWNNAGCPARTLRPEPTVFAGTGAPPGLARSLGCSSRSRGLPNPAASRETLDGVIPDPSGENRPT